MKEILVFVLVIVALIIGVLAGYFYEVQSSAATGILAEAGKTYRTLQSLRAGDTNAAVEGLENDLDQNVISLRFMLNEHPHDKHAKNYTNFLWRVARYRSAHPYHNANTNIDELVTSALNSVSKTNRF